MNADQFVHEADLAFEHLRPSLRARAVDEAYRVFLEESAVESPQDVSEGPAHEGWSITHALP